MSRNRGITLLLALGLLLAVDALWLLAAQSKSPTGAPFQQAVGGVGLSSAVSVGWSFFGFDPRMESTCENELWPIPGLSCPNPYHGATVVDLPPLDHVVD